MLLALLASPSSDQDALATLYGAAGGAAWGWKNDGWLSAGGPCEFQAGGSLRPAWEGVGGCSLDLATGVRVIDLDPLSRVASGGTIPTEIGLLDALSYRLLLTGNGFTGTLPTLIGLLTELKTLGETETGGAGSANAPLKELKENRPALAPLRAGPGGAPRGAARRLPREQAPPPRANALRAARGRAARLPGSAPLHRPAPAFGGPDARPPRRPAPGPAAVRVSARGEPYSELE